MHLPDWSDRKISVYGLEFGHEVVFAGMKSNLYRCFSSPEFSMSIGLLGREGESHSIGILSKNNPERVLKETRPDVVHAHNIFSAKLVSEFEDTPLFTMIMSSGRFMSRGNQRYLDRIK